MIGPEDATVDEGNTLVLTCVGYAEDLPSISWIREDSGAILNQMNDSRITIYEEPLTEGGVTFVKSILEICSAQVSDTGSYSCFADNGVANDTVSFAITVTPEGGRCCSYGTHLCIHQEINAFFLFGT